MLLSSIVASRNFVKYQHHTVPNVNISGSSFNKKIISAAIDIYPQDEYASETVDLGVIGDEEDQILC